MNIFVKKRTGMNKILASFRVTANQDATTLLVTNVAGWSVGNTDTFKGINLPASDGPIHIRVVEYIVYMATSYQGYVIETAHVRPTRRRAVAPAAPRCVTRFDPTPGRPLFNFKLAKQECPKSTIIFSNNPLSISNPIHVTPPRGCESATIYQLMCKFNQMPRLSPLQLRLFDVTDDISNVLVRTFDALTILDVTDLSADMDTVGELDSKLGCIVTSIKNLRLRGCKDESRAPLGTHSIGWNLDHLQSDSDDVFEALSDLLSQLRQMQSQQMAQRFSVAQEIQKLDFEVERNSQLLATSRSNLQAANNARNEIMINQSTERRATADQEREIANLVDRINEDTTRVSTLRGKIYHANKMSEQIELEPNVAIKRFAWSQELQQLEDSVEKHKRKVGELQALQTLRKKKQFQSAQELTAVEQNLEQMLRRQSEAADHEENTRRQREALNDALNDHDYKVRVLERMIPPLRTLLDQSEVYTRLIKEHTTLTAAYHADYLEFNEIEPPNLGELTDKLHTLRDAVNGRSKRLTEISSKLVQYKLDCIDLGDRGTLIRSQLTAFDAAQQDLTNKLYSLNETHDHLSETWVRIQDKLARKTRIVSMGENDKDTVNVSMYNFRKSLERFLYDYRAHEAQTSELQLTDSRLIDSFEEYKRLFEDHVFRHGELEDSINEVNATLQWARGALPELANLYRVTICAQTEAETRLKELAQRMREARERAVDINLSVHTLINNMGQYLPLKNDLDAVGYAHAPKLVDPPVSPRSPVEQSCSMEVSMADYEDDDVIMKPAAGYFY